MRLKSSLFLILLCCATLLNAQQLVATFTIKNAGFNVEGSFSETKIQYAFNPNELKEAYFNAEIEVASIETGINARDKHLLKDKYFDAERFPKMTFKSNAVIKEADQYFILGRLLIKETVKDLKIPLSISNNTFEVVFAINRRDFDVGGNSFILSDDVNIKLKLEK